MPDEKGPRGMGRRMCLQRPLWGGLSSWGSASQGNETQQLDIPSSSVVSSMNQPHIHEAQIQAGLVT